jgi:DNA-binding IclR family transcriptional regulator
MLERSEIRQSPSARRGIRSVETGLRVLAALGAAGGPSTLTSLGARVGLSPSQTHRYLQSLVAAGMAVQDASARYDLGPAVIRIGVAALARMNCFARAEAALARFVEETGWTGLLAVWGEAGPVCVRWLPGRPPVVTSLGVGSVLPLLHSAAGQVFLAFLTPNELAAPLAELPANGEAEAIARRVRARLLAVQSNSALPGLRAIAAPIFDLQGRLNFVAGGLATRAIPDEADGQVTERLRHACREATLASGGKWPA